MTLQPCLVCGELSERNRCNEHRPSDDKPSASARGYDATWQKLSARARRQQPFCSDCYTTEDLTTDHSPEAWKRKAAGKPIRLCDVAVVCRSCNAKRGRARPTGGRHDETVKGPEGKAGFATLSTSREPEGDDEPTSGGPEAEARQHQIPVREYLTSCPSLGVCVVKFDLPGYVDNPENQSENPQPKRQSSRSHDRSLS